MKQKTRYAALQEIRKLSYLTVLLFSITFLLTSCFLKQDRTTTVYGTITDQNGVAVDSILVIVKGVDGFIYDPLKENFSNEAGGYELVVEVPRRYSAINIVIPFGSSVNPKYQKHFKDFLISKNDKPTQNCCTASVGQKTKYDFQLIPK